MTFSLQSFPELELIPYSLIPLEGRTARAWTKAPIIDHIVRLTGGQGSQANRHSREAGHPRGQEITPQ